MFNRILVPLDGSSLAERAIPHAEQFARIFGANIIFLQVLEPTSYHENPKAVDPLSWQIRKAEADVYLQGIATRTRENLGENSLTNEVGKKDRVEYAIREGKTAENIIDFAHGEAIDLLVISTHGSSGFSRWNISGVIQKVINLIYLPILIVRAYDQPELVDNRIHYRRILLPIDSSRRAECALSAGIALARGEERAGSEQIGSVEARQDIARAGSNPQTRLLLAAVISPPELPILEPISIEIQQIYDQLMTISRQAVGVYLNEMRERLPVNCETSLVENQSVSSAIHELASQEEDIDLVVLCAHGYTGQSTWPYGSVARNYIEHGTKPVLVIQDVSRSQVRPTASQIAAEKSGRR
jgi:nucleotide-binding universal stress UspA family protein